MVVSICVNVCHMCMGQKVPNEDKGIEPMELELQVVISHLVYMQDLQSLQPLLCGY